MTGLRSVSFVFICENSRLLEEIGLFIFMLGVDSTGANLCTFKDFSLSLDDADFVSIHNQTIWLPSSTP